jgi:uncharacterized protein
MRTLPLRLNPDDDLRGALESAAQTHGISAGFVIGGIGSLRVAALRLAGASKATMLEGDLEILTLAGTLSPNGAHLHMSVADAAGRVTGGHVLRGCVVRTTAEVLLADLPDWRFARAPDAATGYAELVIHAVPDKPPG